MRQPAQLAISVVLTALLVTLPNPANGEDKAMTVSTETATLGGGCFWCIEAIFQKLRGVTHVESGYSGGSIPNPTYEQVSSGTSGHAEVIQLRFNPAEITFSDILNVFFHLHDPTTLNRQGADRGTQYRSVIFYHGDAQKKTAEEAVKRVSESGLWKDPIVTQIQPLQEYYKAEDYHQNYYRSNPNQPYCSIVIAPKIQKLYKEFGDRLKKE